MKRLFSGIQPTGSVHIGNYLGAIKNWVQLQNEFESYICIVDHHATTVEYKPEAFRKATLDMAITLLAAGVDPDKATLYVQSMVPEHTELAWIFNTVTMFGDLGRMTQFKDKSQDNQHNINVGLFTYPVLQAADILLFQAEAVPVGEDQVQHLELSRETARRWNRRFGEGFFPEPTPHLSPAKRVMGLDGKSKMSKSKGNDLGITETEDERWAKLKTAFTDPQRLRLKDPGRPEICNIFALHGFFSNDNVIAKMDADCRSAEMGCFTCKKALNASMEDELGPIRERAEYYESRHDEVWDILRAGGGRARKVARETMVQVREKMGLPGVVE